MSIFRQNKYTKWYYNIILSRKIRIRDKNMYYEHHHIIPQCKPFKGSSKPENMVYLTFQEHFLVHWLLTKMCINTNQKHKMNFAFRSFLRYNRETQDRIFTSKHFSILKTHARNNMQGENHSFYGNNE